MGLGHIQIYRTFSFTYGFKKKIETMHGRAVWSIWFYIYTHHDHFGLLSIPLLLLLSEISENITEIISVLFIIQYCVQQSLEDFSRLYQLSQML